jgi:hypothetical protein
MYERIKRMEQGLDVKTLLISLYEREKVLLYSEIFRCAQNDEGKREAIYVYHGRPASFLICL